MNGFFTDFCARARPRVILTTYEPDRRTLLLVFFTSHAFLGAAGLVNLQGQPAKSIWLLSDAQSVAVCECPLLPVEAKMWGQ